MTHLQPRLRIPPFAVFALAAWTATAGIGLLFTVAISRGAPAHAAGMLLKACTSLFQFAGGVVSLMLLSLPFLLALAGFAHGARTQWKTSRVLRGLHSRGLSNAPELVAPAAAKGLSGRIDVVACDELIALTHGLLRPRVLLSRGTVETLTPSELQAVLAHEASHLKRRDPLRLLGAEVVSSAFLIFPLIRDLARHFVVATELAADRAAVAAVTRRALAAGLLKFIETPRQLAVPCLALESTNDERIAALLRPSDFVHSVTLSRGAVQRTLLSSTVIAVMLGVLFALPPML
ncbi:MAG: M56 family metallopeptidase [Gaiellaceae bacterium]